MPIIIILILFLIILLLFKPKQTEKFKNIYDCPVLLVKVLNKFLAYYPNNERMLYNNNPIIFNSVAEYHKYMEYQESKGLNCPYLNSDDSSKIIPTEKIFPMKSIPISKGILKNLINQQKI